MRALLWVHRCWPALLPKQYSSHPSPAPNRPAPFHRPFLQRALASYASFSNEAKQAQLWSLLNDLLGRRSSDDFLYVYLVLVNQFVVEVRRLAGWPGVRLQLVGWVPLGSGSLCGRGCWVAGWVPGAGPLLLPVLLCRLAGLEISKQAVALLQDQRGMGSAKPLDRASRPRAASQPAPTCALRPATRRRCPPWPPPPRAETWTRCAA